MKLFLFALFLSCPMLCFAQEKAEPINHSLIAFTLSEKDLLPENIAYDPTTQSFFVGSTRKGKIVRIDPAGQQKDFIAPRQDGLWMIIGMKVDPQRRWLWVCSSGGENLVDYTLNDKVEGRPAGIFKFDLDSGKLIKKYVLDQPGAVHFFNDLVLDEAGNAYITHMFQQSGIYTIGRKADQLELWVQDSTLQYPNGITISEDGRYLFVAHSGGIGRIDVATRQFTALDNPQQIEISRRASADGLYCYRNSLVMIQSDLNTVQQLILSEDLQTITDQRLLEVEHPMMKHPTTGVLVDRTLYYIANAQFESFQPDGTLFPLEKLYEPTILQVTLPK